MIYTDQIEEAIHNNLITPEKHPSLYDPEFQKNFCNAPWKEWLSRPGYFDVLDEYLETFENWIVESKNNSVQGLNNFKYVDVTVGTTQTFDEAYFRYSSKQLRTFSAEYRYHSRNVNVKVLDTEMDYIPLENNDWVIVSLPFSGTGNEHKFFNVLLKDAEDKNVPVIVDCAWFGTCYNINFNFNSPSIVAVTYSLSKGIGMGNMRTGVRYSNYKDGCIRQQNNFNHLVFSNMQIGLWQMQKFKPDFVCNKYLTYYKKMCSDYNFKETKCMHVAVYQDKLLGVRNLVKGYFKNDNNTHSR
jgi:hypothetical protein